MQKVNNSLFLIILLFSPLTLLSDDGALLFGGNCVTCHYETESISAPSMKDVRERYKSVFPQKSEFVKYMSVFILEPKEEYSIMQERVKKYKLMPLLGYERSVAEEIASYIYDAEF